MDQAKHRPGHSGPSHLCGDDDDRLLPQVNCSAMDLRVSREASGILVQHGADIVILNGARV